MTEMPGDIAVGFVSPGVYPEGGPKELLLLTVRVAGTRDTVVEISLDDDAARTLQSKVDAWLRSLTK
jgi:hypothetical protein